MCIRYNHTPIQATVKIWRSWNPQSMTGMRNEVVTTEMVRWFFNMLNRLSCDPEILKSVCTHMFIAALFTIAKTWTQSIYPLIDEGISKMWLYKHIGIFFSIIKDKILQHTITWKSIEDIMPSEISQTKKDKYC